MIAGPWSNPPVLLAKSPPCLADGRVLFRFRTSNAIRSAIFAVSATLR
jgi:hypothetical protein